MSGSTQQIREFISGHVDGIQLDADEDLFEGGYVNSLFVVQLVMWIERTFDIQVTRADLDFANFRTISLIAGLVERKAAKQVPPTLATTGQ
jgi:methoxymalonate biosynthesis acyl carrier protein